MLEDGEEVDAADGEGDESDDGGFLPGLHEVGTRVVRCGGEGWGLDSRERL